MAADATLTQLCEELRRSADEERRRLARALHESASQVLAAAAMSLSIVEQDARGLTPRGREALARAQELLGACTGELRQISHDLYPPLLSEVGLPPALRWLRRKLGDDRVMLALPDDLPRQRPEIELVCYRVVEEGAIGLFDPAEPLDVVIGAGPALHLHMTGKRRGRRGEHLRELGLRRRVRDAGGRLRIAHEGRSLSLVARF
jgi:signal transduction histidine kinase